MTSTSGQSRPPLSVLDATAILVGIVVGAGIYESAPSIARNVWGPGWLAVVWILGGLIALVGALCYAELTSAYPREGGEYVFLTRALGRRWGFLFAWAQLWVVRPGSIGAMAYVFARYAQQLVPLHPRYGLVLYASASLVVLSTINLLGVRESKWTQNLLSGAKIAGLLAVAAVAMWGQAPDYAPKAAAAAPINFRLALIFVMFCYGGWNDTSLVTGEVRHPQRNVPRALLAGTLAVATVYLLTNLAFLHVLGFEGMRSSEAVASDALRAGLGPEAGRIISLIVCISCLGAIHGMIFTGSRLYSTAGEDHALFRKLSYWSPRLGTPARSLVVQAMITLGLTLSFGLNASGFERLVTFTTPIFWFFFLLVGISLPVLRRKDPQLPRPYRVLGYPVTPLVFCLSCLFMLHASLTHAWQHASWEAFWAIGLLAVGVLFSYLEPGLAPLSSSTPPANGPSPSK